MLTIFRISVFIHLSAALLWPIHVFADESRPVYVEITQLTKTGYRVDWKVPPVLPEYALPEIHLPADCNHTGVDDDQITSFNGSILYACSSLLTGRDISIVYPVINPALSAIIRLRTLNEEEYIGVLPPQELSWQVPEVETQFSVALQYTRLGVVHILAGLDHLLFMTCLLWIAGGMRRILIAITGFTVAHSATLILSSLEMIRVPIPPTEAVIALSIVFLAREIAVNRKDSLTWRFPASVSTSFGLLHGLGFASALAQVGLPQTALLTGLLSFNLGVEIGQLLFVGAISVLFLAGQLGFHLWRKENPNGGSLILGMARLRALGSYSIGIVSSYWLVSRIADFAKYQQ
tara:strand:+ start:243 stop:1286 length:1044 start_codon:yes stop_codon:yes gene_type:complete